MKGPALSLTSYDSLNIIGNKGHFPNLSWMFHLITFISLCIYLSVIYICIFQGSWTSFHISTRDVHQHFPEGGLKTAGDFSQIGNGHNPCHTDYVRGPPDLLPLTLWIARGLRWGCWLEAMLTCRLDLLQILILFLGMSSSSTVSMSLATLISLLQSFPPSLSCLLVQRILFTFEMRFIFCSQNSHLFYCGLRF